ncbi:MAG: SirB1 family protein [Candidatus Bathyarchaeia archaeon]
MTSQSAGKELEERLSKMDEKSDIIETCLHIAAEEYTNLNIRKYLDFLDTTADELSKRLGSKRSPRDVIKVLNAFLFDEKKFVGNVTEYNDPRNSFLNEVLERKTGIPITLSLIYMELARRVDLHLLGIGMPGHFLLKFVGSESFFVDPFNHGEVLDEEGCRKKFIAFSRGQIEFKSQFLDPVTKRQMVFRLLSNLKAIYLGSQDFARALRIIELMILVNPSSTVEFRDRALVYHQMHRDLEAIQDLEKYAALVKDSEERATITRFIRDLKINIETQRMYV